MIQELKEKDYDSLYAFVKELYLGRDSSFEESLKDEYSKFLQKDFAALFNEIKQEVILEIRAFFILRHGIGDFNREFWIAEGKDGELLAKLLSVYSFSVKRDAFQPLVKRANRFLKEMRKDRLLEYWLEFKDYAAREIEKEYVLDSATELAEKLRQLSSGEKLHFFDFARHAATHWNENSTFSTRSFGVDERESAAAMVALGIFQENRDLEAIPAVTSKGELKEAAEKAGFELKKSWTLQKIYESLRKTDSGEKFLADYLQNQTVFLFNEKYRSDLPKILEHQERIKRLVDLIAML